MDGVVVVCVAVMWTRCGSVRLGHVEGTFYSCRRLLHDVSQMRLFRDDGCGRLVNKVEKQLHNSL